jgi:5-methylcytosine-specific restriction endonuclease McrA
MAGTKTINKSYTKTFYYKRKNYCLDYLKGKCINCGSIEQLEFDHIDPTTKVGHITRMFSVSHELLIAELNKCQLLCQPCHMAKTKSAIVKPKHGTISRYTNQECRCTDCKQANKLYNYNRHMKIKLANK